MRILPSLLILSISILGCSTQGDTQSAGSGKQTARQYLVPAPNFELKDINGNTFSLTSMKGKVVFLDFWATWCPPCVVATPEVEKLHEDYKNRNVEVVSLSLDESEDIVRKFISRYHMTSRVALAFKTDINNNYGVSGIPTFFLIDQEGKIVNSWEGYSPRMISMWRKELDRLLGA